MSVTLVTGADGHVGGAVTRWLLANTGRRLLLCVRARDRDEWAQKRRRLPDDARCSVIRADLQDADPFAAVEPAQVRDIVHCAAVIDFTMTRATALAVNVGGTRRVIELARRCPRLQRFGLVSTLYSAGLASGPLEEAPLDDEPDFANDYEWSKWVAERLVIDEPGLPWQVFRLATVLADGADGRVSQQNVIHNTLKLMFYGMLPVLPGDPATRVYTVTTDYAASGIAELLVRGDARRVFHLSDDAVSAPRLGEMTDAAWDAFREDPEFRRAGILKPRFCDRDSFLRLAESARQFGTAMAQSFTSVAPFVKQLYADKAVSTARAVGALGGRRPPGGRDVAAAVAHGLAARRWARVDTSKP